MNPKVANTLAEPKTFLRFLGPSGTIEWGKQLDASDPENIVVMRLGGAGFDESTAAINYFDHNDRLLHARQLGTYQLQKGVYLPPVNGEDVEIICYGVNFTDHQKEGEQEDIKEPPLFGRNSHSIASHARTLVLPNENAYDYEGEIAFLVVPGGDIEVNGQNYSIVMVSPSQDLSGRKGQGVFEDPMSVVQWRHGKSYDESAPVLG
jgi:2-keto-4-pentenoate hydratase/2-oxohepta-3-ene-1,7-dioic acid hydratase in catechol pathway|tara:strand:+ start:398 stop:1015 length:618 start_codon:yes stop_codon:yes gene_type:complete